MAIAQWAKQSSKKVRCQGAIEPRVRSPLRWAEGSRPDRVSASGTSWSCLPNAATSRSRVGVTSAANRLIHGQATGEFSAAFAQLATTTARGTYTRLRRRASPRTIAAAARSTLVVTLPGYGSRARSSWNEGRSASRPSDEVRVDEPGMDDAHGDTEVSDLLAVSQREHFDSCFACGVCGEPGQRREGHRGS